LNKGVATATGASLSYGENWHAINWPQVYRNVRRLQTRIVKAVKAGRKRKVRALRNILTCSFSGKVLAIKRVSSNQGKRTPGVDNVLWNTPKKKAQALGDLRSNGYQPLPLKRVYLRKKDGTPRPIGIPAMRDRARQALHLLPLDPVAETLADPNSHGFRKERSTADAIAQCFNALAKKTSPQWVLEGDIKGCYDGISHNWLLAHIPMDKGILQKWLKAGYVEQHVLYPTDVGTPQGGIISPALANMTLAGLGRALREKFSATERLMRNSQVNLVLYADDFIITGRTKELLADEVKPLVESFLQERGLELSQTKTRITHIRDGFDFLGQNIRKYQGKLLIKPSTRSVQALVAKVREVVKGSLHLSAGLLVQRLNPIIKGWANYHQHVVSKKTFGQVDTHIFRMLWRWIKRKHPKKSVVWRRKKYFPANGTRNWVFTGVVAGKTNEQKTVHLYNAQDTPIKRHLKIRGEANPYDQEWEVYFEERLGLQMVNTPKGYRRLVHLWYGQEGSCAVCAQKITRQSGWATGRFVRRTSESNRKANLVLLHPACHRRVRPPMVSSHRVPQEGAFRRT
jgi:RNA-directed DNA polymerase